MRFQETLFIEIPPAAKNAAGGIFAFNIHLQIRHLIRMRDMSYLQIEKQQQQEVASYHRSEASQNPRAKTALPS